MLKRLVCWGVGLLLLVGGTAALAQPPGGVAQGKEMRGQLVRVDPEKGIVVIKVGTGATAKEQEFRVAKTTRYFGKENKLLTDGLKYTGWKADTPVWYRLSGPERNMTIGELRLGPAPLPPGKGGAVPPAPGRVNP